MRARAGRPADLIITADMIAAPIAVDASGELTPDEMHQLGVCERAVENLATVTWLAGKALQTICNRNPGSSRTRRTGWPSSQGTG